MGFNAERLLYFCDVMKTVKFDASDKTLYYYGDKLRGVIKGLGKVPPPNELDDDIPF